MRETAKVIGLGGAVVLLVGGLVGGCAFGWPAYLRYQAREDAANNVRVTAIQIQNTDQLIEVEKKKKKAEDRVAEAHGIAESQSIISGSLTSNYLQYLAINAQKEMAHSPNHTQGLHSVRAERHSPREERGAVDERTATEEGVTDATGAARPTRKAGEVSNRTDWDRVAVEIDGLGAERIAIELHNAFIAGQESVQEQIEHLKDEVAAEKVARESWEDVARSFLAMIDKAIAAADRGNGKFRFVEELRSSVADFRHLRPEAPSADQQGKAREVTSPSRTREQLQRSNQMLHRDLQAAAKANQRLRARIEELEHELEAATDRGRELVEEADARADAAEAEVARLRTELDRLRAEPSGVRINRRANTGAAIVWLKQMIADAEKQARKTPPKTLKTECEKVQLAKDYLPRAYERLAQLEREYEELRMQPAMHNREESKG